MSNTYPTIHTVGLSGVLVTFAEALDDTANRAALAFRAAVDAQGWDWVQESATSLISAFFRTDLAQHSAAGITEQLTDLLATRDWFAAPCPRGASCGIFRRFSVAIWPRNWTRPPRPQACHHRTPSPN